MLIADNLTNVLQKGSLTTEGGGVQLAALSEIDTSKLFEMLGLSLVKPVQFSVRVGDDEASAGIRLHFEGNGWKLSGINLPKRAIQELAQSLPEAGRAQKS